MIGDGAEWIRHLGALHYPQATCIVDYWHACEHIHALGAAHYGQGSLRGKRWAAGHARALKEKGPGPLLRALKRMRPKDADAQEAIRLAQRYFGGNRERMQYPDYLARGLTIGSGVVEAACKTLVGNRLKRAGMRWSRPGADAILALRARVLSHDYEDLLPYAKAA